MACSGAHGPIWFRRYDIQLLRYPIEVVVTAELKYTYTREYTHKGWQDPAAALRLAQSQFVVVVLLVFPSPECGFLVQSNAAI